jgi:hypothetical protein
MVKVLAAELSDQGRLARGKRYWSDNAVTDIVIGHGAVTAEIQGSRPEAYIVTITATPGSGVPGKREVTVRCTCPDDGMFEACKHAVAALFALSDEIAVEPELVERWRGGSAARPRPAPVEPGLAEVVPLRAAREPAPVSRREPSPVPVDPMIAEIGVLLAAPEGATAPEFPEVTSISHGAIRDRPLADVLIDAIEHLAINWE